MFRSSNHIELIRAGASAFQGATLAEDLNVQVAGYGEVLSSTVRVKDGINKSWALITFKEPGER